MTEQELYKKAESFYYQEGKELNAIEAFKELLKVYPNNLDGWTHLSTMQHKITDFDGAIFSINKAIELAPDNAWTINQKCTLLSLISRLPSEGQMYFDEQTREAHEIKSYPQKTDLIFDLISDINRLLELEGNNERKKHSHLWRLSHNYRAINQNEEAIKTLLETEKSIPSKYNTERRNREIANINREISSNYFALKNYSKAIEHLNKAFEFGLDDYKRTMLYEIHQEMGDHEKAKNVLVDLVDRINTKLKKAPEPAYISQKVEILKMLGDTNALKNVLQHFDDIDETPYSIGRKNEIQQEIEKYLQHGI